MLGACFLPAQLIRRVRDHQLNTNELLIEGPERVKHTLYAKERDYGGWILSLDSITEQLPSAPTWRKWLSDHENIDPDDRSDLAKWLWDNRETLREYGPSKNWLDSEIPDYRWDQYLEGRYAIYESPEARALHYLSGLNLANGPIVDRDGNDVGSVHFYHGTMPGADWHFVDVEGVLILPALQHRLRELGEETLIEVVA